MPEPLTPPKSPHLQELEALVQAVRQGDLDGVLDHLDPEKLQLVLKDLAGQTKAVKVLLRAARARHYYRPRPGTNGGPHHAA